MGLKPKCSKLKYEWEVEKSIDSTFNEFEGEGKKREKRREGKSQKDIESSGSKRIHLGKEGLNSGG